MWRAMFAIILGWQHQKWYAYAQYSLLSRLKLREKRDILGFMNADMVGFLSIFISASSSLPPCEVAQAGLPART